jgi:hypothetical protein
MSNARTIACLIFLAYQATAVAANIEGHRVLSSTTAAGPNFGWEVDPIVDLNGDGIDDILASTPNRANATGVVNSGAVEIRSGANGALLRTLLPTVGSTQFGFVVEEVGDINRDGLSDVIVGAPAFGAGRGQAFVFSGADGAQLWRGDGPSGGEGYGTRAASAGDFDGDGYADFLVASPSYAQPVANTGRVYLYSGRTLTLARTYSAQSNAELFGSNVATMGDLDGDRVDEHLISAQNGGGAGRGRAYVFSGASGTLLRTFQGPVGGATFGFGFATGAGDFNGDRVPDAFIGDFGAGNGNGRALVYSGADGAILFRVDGTQQAGVGTGRGVRDVTGDGLGDLIVGHYTSSAGAPGAGRVVVYAGPDGRVAQTITDNAIGANLGFDAAALSDVDGDGKPDLLLSAATGNRVDVVAGSSATGAALIVPDTRHNGLWFDPTHDGEGFGLEMLADGRAVVYWFTYDRMGRQRFLVSVGEVIGSRVVFRDLVGSRGGRFGTAFVSDDVTRFDEGQLVLSFDGCDSGHAEYLVDGVRGKQRLTRLSAVAGVTCAAPVTARLGGFSGSWYKPEASGEGWVIQAISDHSMVVMWFSYNSDGTQQWFIGAGEFVGDEVNFTQLVRATGGRFGTYFRPDEVSRSLWGSLRVRFLSCNRARFDWNGLDGTGGTEITRLTTLGNAPCQF